MPKPDKNKGIWCYTGQAANPAFCGNTSLRN